MTVLVGGAGSSGSTLLASELNKHESIVCGPELNFFNKRHLFDDWHINKNFLLVKKYSLVTEGWFPYPGNNLLDPFYGWGSPQLNDLVQKSVSLSQFSDSFFSKTMKEKAASIWVEKTPSNAYCFNHFLKAYPYGKLIHMVRNPYDAVASLMNRGMDEYFAAGLWLSNVSHALSGSWAGSQYIEVSYEKLTEDPDFELAKVFDFLEVSNTNNPEKPPAKRKHDRLESWHFRPDEGIKKPIVSSFSRATLERQHRIMFALARFRISEAASRQYGLKVISCEQACERLGYEYYPPQKKYLLSLSFQLAKDYTRRAIKRYPSSCKRYPGSIRNMRQ